MKFRIYMFILAAAALLWLKDTPASAQTATRQNIDTDILNLRTTVAPGYSYAFDEYLQYAPPALMLGLKACGYEGRSSWGRMIVSDLFSGAIMIGATKGLKYAAGRARPDGSGYDSFPSGHTATAFMGATMLHKEYGWKSPWFSIGGYTVAAVTGVSRILNNKHWMSDVVAGAAIGIGSVHLGYFLSDLIFKDRQLCDGFTEPEFSYDASRKHYVAELAFGQRFVIGNKVLKESGVLPMRGGMAALSTDIPIVPGIGLTGSFTASSLSYDGSSEETEALYTAMAGGFCNFHFARILEFQVKAMAGYAHTESPTTSAYSSGIDLCAGAGLSIITGNNFKFKVFADFEAISRPHSQPWLNIGTIGFSSGWFW